jgi:hypothetical protein
VKGRRRREVMRIGLRVRHFCCKMFGSLILGEALLLLTLPKWRHVIMGT